MTGNHDSAFWPASENTTLATVAGSFNGLHMDRGIEGITRRARALSYRRRAVPGVAAVAFAAAVGAVVVAGPGRSPAPAVAVAGTDASAGNIALTGFTVQNDLSNGIITVTVKNFSDPSGLAAALAKYGVKVQLIPMNIPSQKIVERAAKAMGTSGDTYYFGPGWTRQPKGTYQIQINVKALGAERVQQIVVVKGSGPAGR